MAKVKRGIITLSGKIGNDVIVHGQHNSSYIRKAVQPGVKKDEPSLKRQYSRTAFLNKLASEINKAIEVNSDNFKSPRFYSDLQKRFRRESSNKRCLLLLQLKGMEIHPRYPLEKLGETMVNVKAVRNKALVTVKVQRHPNKGVHNANCYYYEVLMMMWDKSKKAAKYKRQISDWVYMKAGKPVFEFEFQKPASVTHWLVCLRQRLGMDETLVESFEGEGMKIVDIGSFDKKEQALMNGHESDYKPKYAKGLGTRKEEVLVRVKAKRIE